MDKFGLFKQDIVGVQYGTLTVISQEARGRSDQLKVFVQCGNCQHQFWSFYHNMRKRPKTRACPNCNPRRPLIVPKWLYQRCQAQHSRCTVPSNVEYQNYGARGIEFRFDSVNSATVWIKENLGIPTDRKKQLDRINNNGHYEPGNLRWVTAPVNQNNTRKSSGINRERFMHFRLTYPEIRYADSTLSKLIRTMSDLEIIARWNTPSNKPKGKYGIFSTQGLYRGILQTGT